MATLSITEFSSIPLATVPAGGSFFSLPAPLLPVITEQHVAIGGSSAASAAFDPTTRFVMINTDQPCSVAWGTAPVAVATAQRLGANETRFYGVPPGGGFKVAVITNT